MKQHNTTKNKYKGQKWKYYNKTHLTRNRNGIQNHQDHQLIRLILVPDVGIPNVEMVSTALLKSLNANTVTKLDTLHTAASRSRGIPTTNNTLIERTFMELGPLMMAAIINTHQMTVTQ